MKEVRKIYLLRHCEPLLPKEVGFCLGRKDIPLSDGGRKQAHYLKNFFSTLEIDNIYSSPLCRARETAEIIANSREVISRDGFSELNTGKWDGLSFDEIKEKFPAEYEERGKNLEYYVIEGGESFAQCRERAILEVLKSLNESKGHILIVTHVGVIRMLISYVSGIATKESFQIKTKYGHWITLYYDECCMKMGGENI